MSLDQELLRQIDEHKSGAENKRSIAQLVHQRERGMWSFLTWSFFLSQLVGSGLLSTGAAKAADAPELASASDETGSGKAAGSLSNEADEVAGTDESTEASTTTIVSGLQSGQTGNLEAKVAGLASPENEVAQGQHEGADGAVAAVSGSSELGSGEDGDCGCPSSNHNPVTDGHGQDQDDTPPVLVDNGGTPVTPGLSPIIDAVGDVIETAENTVIDPVIDLVGDVTETVGDLVETVADNVLSPVTETVGGLLSSVTEDVLSPLLEPVDDLVETLADNVLSPLTESVDGLLSSVTEDVLSPLLDPVDKLVETLSDDVLSPVLEPATGLVAQVAEDVLSPVTEPVLDLVSSVADDIISPVTDPVFQIASKVTDPILEPVEAVAATVIEPVSAVLDPITDAASPILNPVTDIVASTPLGGLFSGLLGGSDASESSVASGGTMEFAQSGIDTGNDLYVDGSYTQYGVAMQTGDEPETGSAVDSGSQDTDQIALVDLVDIDGTDGGGPLDVSKLLSGAGLHQFGDGLFA